jgi:LPS-assembly lipoprotein
MQRRTLISWAVAATATTALSACGFALRKAPEFAFSTLYSGLPESSPLGVELRRSLNATRKVTVISDARQLSEAEVILDVLLDQREKVVLSTNSNGQVREFQLRLRFRFKLRTLAGKELIPDTELLLQREINFSETQVLAKESEEALLYRDMQSDIVQQLMRRLAAVTKDQLA